jgi:hypothetical protein
MELRCGMVGARDASRRQAERPNPVTANAIGFKLSNN